MLASFHHEGRSLKAVVLRKCVDQLPHLHTDASRAVAAHAQMYRAVLLHVPVVQGVLETLGCSEANQAALVAHMLAFHQSAAAQLGAAPRQFLACAELYAATVSYKREQLLQQQHFLKVCCTSVEQLCFSGLNQACHVSPWVRALQNSTILSVPSSSCISLYITAYIS